MHLRKPLGKQRNPRLWLPLLGSLANETLQLRDCKNVRFENKGIWDRRTRPAQFKVTGTEHFTESGNTFTPSTPKGAGTLTLTAADAETG